MFTVVELSILPFVCPCNILKRRKWTFSEHPLGEELCSGNCHILCLMRTFKTTLCVWTSDRCLMHREAKKVAQGITALESAFKAKSLLLQSLSSFTGCLSALINNVYIIQTVLCIRIIPPLLVPTFLHDIT